VTRDGETVPRPRTRLDKGVRGVNELLTILDAIEANSARGRRMALATIVGVRGSTYRHEGARLLVTEQQEMIGSISGGCLESDVMVVAEEVMRSGTPRLVTYDLTADDDAVWGLGLGCNGAIELFVERVDDAGGEWARLRHALTDERTLTVLTVVAGGANLGARMLVGGDGPREGTLGNQELDERAMRAAVAGQQEGTSRVHALAGPRGEVRVFVEVIRPPIRLIVCGAGHDAIPLVRLAASLGWRVVVVDSRDRFLTHDRFPGAQRFIRAAPDEAGARVPIDPRTYVVMMTHNFLHDRGLLRGFLATDARYLGMLGPKVRTQKILDELERDGALLAGRDLDRIHGPLGLDIGSDGPEEIALAIVSEILAVDTSRPGGFLRDRSGAIHQAANTATRRS